VIPFRPACTKFAMLLCMILAGASAVCGPSVELSAKGAGPREMEPTLQQSIPRDYVKAWQLLSTALDAGNPELLDQYWVGIARDKFQRLIRDEARTGIEVHYQNISHKLQAVFYPTDGAALLLYDDVQLEMQVKQSTRVIHTEKTTARYLVLMTPAQDRWVVRLLQEVPLS
jgi:hypothetical protein